MQINSCVVKWLLDVVKCCDVQCMRFVMWGFVSIEEYEDQHWGMCKYEYFLPLAQF